MGAIYVNWKIIIIIIIFWDYLLDEDFWILIELGFLIYIEREFLFSVFFFFFTALFFIFYFFDIK